MKDVSESFGAKRAERKEYRAAKKDAFEKARDRGELKFDATTPLDSSFTSLTAATAANIFAKNKARKAVKSNFDKSYLANKASKNNSTIGSSENGASIPNSAESDYNREKNAIEAKIEKNRNSYTPDTESQSIARNTYTPKNKDNSVKPTAPASKPSSSPSKGMAAAFSPERIAQYKAKGWAMDNTTHRIASKTTPGGAPKNIDFMSYTSNKTSGGAPKGHDFMSYTSKKKSSSPIANNPLQSLRANNPLKSLRNSIQSFKNDKG